MRRAALPLLATALACAGAYAASPNMQEGMWEITTKMEMTGQKGTQMPTQTLKHCMTRKDIEDPRRSTPSAGDPGRCKLTDHKLQGNTATWKMACEGEGAMIGTGTVTYSGTSYQGSQTMSMKRGNQVLNMKMDYSGRRVGDCPKK